MLEKHESKKKNEKIRHNNMNASAYCKKSKKKHLTRDEEGRLIDLFSWIHYIFNFL